MTNLFEDVFGLIRSIGEIADGSIRTWSDQWIDRSDRSYQASYDAAIELGESELVYEFKSAWQSLAVNLTALEKSHEWATSSKEVRQAAWTIEAWMEGMSSAITEETQGDKTND